MRHFSKSNFFFSFHSWCGKGTEIAYHLLGKLCNKKRTGMRLCGVCTSTAVSFLMSKAAAYREFEQKSGWISGKTLFVDSQLYAQWKEMDDNLIPNFYRLFGWHPRLFALKLNIPLQCMQWVCLKLTSVIQHERYTNRKKRKQRRRLCVIKCQALQFTKMIRWIRWHFDS